MRAGGGKAISIIGFIGSVFSPWYAWSGRKRPENHVCINVATYGPGGRFAMTDRGASALRQNRDRLTVGGSSMRWTGDALVIDVDEVSSWPLVSRLRGRITVTPDAVTSAELPLTPDGAHVWRPFAPSSRIEVALERPGWQWEGHGYFDANFGTRALEQDFDTWSWGRFATEDGATCFYDVARRDGSRLECAIELGGDGSARPAKLPPKVRLPRTLWGIARETRCAEGFAPRQVQAMLDVPFYCRSVVETRIGVATATGVHETLDLRRFRSPLLKPMLALRVPRRPGWRFDEPDAALNSPAG
ncbi:carotenoid 1,2-hydratase [Sulfitobacter sp. D35]|uniref:carotenoid 1,2-hydratase n=1 Tax=Sulfitobacter sp. D35 TaxID=3083252 RepID=UPI00296F71BD|nr:carotenoid 1,2-hydratase [Sulfitobacter sp. D35]MDW4499424.1 carotenoid 1,2-hydratase [Sulfitobacter sp. D35]